MAAGVKCGGMLALLALLPLLHAASVNQELSDILKELWRLDTNRLKPGTDYTISLQGKAGYVTQGSTNARDYASSPLFSYVNENKLRGIATYRHFMKLLDNYEMATGIAESVTPEEIKENNDFLDAILETQVMKRAHRYLVGKGQSQADLKQFKTQLYNTWFRLYHRGRNGGADSSGFEHVFVGETKFGTEILGLHNWVQFYLQEKSKNLDYKGYKATFGDVPYADDHVLNVQFSWHGLMKPVGGVFLGVSPEFEVAIYTILFLSSDVKTTTAAVDLDGYQVELVVHRHGISIGTSYPKLLRSNKRRL
ncbi:uridylate-specific endoribonuclease C [Denticeps clupeoides]|uniref:Uridylate-specific endoribonuclease n=1 Tax=Denticeps clupeoides TaxID=299321 RepID=A0AAY4BNL8_9TELE|nr:poly(U)-specific endoribonuclease-C-like [Denticeps clupeoides]